MPPGDWPHQFELFWSPFEGQVGETLTNLDSEIDLDYFPILRHTLCPDWPYYEAIFTGFEATTA